MDKGLTTLSFSEMMARCTYKHLDGTPEQDNDKTNVEPVHSYDAFHTRHVDLVIG